MTDSTRVTPELRCLECNRHFTDAEVAAITARPGDEASVLDCARCGSHNLVRSQPRPGFNEQPGLVVVAVAKGDIEVAEAFKEHVEPGVYVHPVTAGSSR